MKDKLFIYILCSISLGIISGAPYVNGIDVFFNSDLSKYAGLRVGVVANHTSIDSDGIYYAVKNRCEDEPLDEFWNAIWRVHKNELK